MMRIFCLFIASFILTACMSKYTLIEKVNRQLTPKTDRIKGNIYALHIYEADDAYAITVNPDVLKKEQCTLQLPDKKLSDCGVSMTASGVRECVTDNNNKASCEMYLSKEDYEFERNYYAQLIVSKVGVNLLDPSVDLYQVKFKSKADGTNDMNDTHPRIILRDFKSPEITCAVMGGMFLEIEEDIIISDRPISPSCPSQRKVEQPAPSGL